MTNEKIQSLLSKYATALDAGEFARASQLYDTLLDEYDTVRAEEVAKVRGAIVTRDHGDVDRNQRQTLNDFAESYLGVQFGRTGITTSVGVLETIPEEVEAGTITDQATDLADREAQFAVRESAAESVLESATIPGALTFVRVPSFRTPVPLGTDITISLTAENVGDKAVEDVTVSAEGAPFSDKTDDGVGTLSAGESYEFKRVVDAVTTGETVLTVAVNGTDTPQEQREVTYTVNSKLQFASTVIDRLQLLSDQISTTELLNKGRQKSLITKLDAAIQSINDAISVAEDGDNTTADKKLSTAINQLGAFLNQVSEENRTASGKNESRGNGDKKNKEGAKINDNLRDQFTRSTEDSIELLNTARTADIAE